MSVGILWKIRPRKFFRLRPDGEVRLRNAFIIKCMDVIKDAEGNITEIHCEYDPDSRSGLPGASRKVKGTIHWVSAAHGVNAEVRLYDRLFNVANPWLTRKGFPGVFESPDSLDIITTVRWLSRPLRQVDPVISSSLNVWVIFQ